MVSNGRGGWGLGTERGRTLRAHIYKYIFGILDHIPWKPRVSCIILLYVVCCKVNAFATASEGVREICRRYVNREVGPLFNPFEAHMTRVM